MILTSGTVSYLGTSVAIFSLATIAFIGSVKILKSWDFNSTSNLQYSNEKYSFLISTIIYFLLMIKIILSFYILYLIDSLVPFIKAAMCGVGVINATSYGWYLLGLKIILLVLFGLWISAHNKDMQETNYPFLKFKFRFFILIYLLLIIELILDLQTIIGLDTQRIVSCCSVTFANTNKIGDFISLSRDDMGITFGIVFTLYFILGVLSYFRQKISIAFGFVSIMMIYTGLLVTIYTFSPYVYELPTHTCPFCLIQKEYHYVGYAFYILLIFGSFFGIKSGFNYLFLKTLNKKDIILSLALNTLFVLIGLYYVLGYYFHNGVWL
ncbi:MAG: hypothetical protein M0O97_01860 [Arcobacteraceae bacterium]|nr:hypothetical protein [Arcobacteraceae bacterium]